MADKPEAAWKCKVKAGNLMSRIHKHAKGEIEMTASQLRAAEIFLKKVVPDLKSIEMTGRDGGAMETSLTVSFVDTRPIEDGVTRD